MKNPIEIFGLALTLLLVGSCGDLFATDSGGGEDGSDGGTDGNDLCPSDPNKTTPGICGCGKPDVDSDGDNTLDCLDNCPSDPEKTEPGKCGCGHPEGTCSNPVPIITASGDNAAKGEGKENAFDGDVNTKWLTFTDAAWIQYEFGGGTAKIIKAYAMTSANDFPERDPRHWKLMGSNNGTDWTPLSERTDDCFPNRLQRKEYRIDNTSAYQMYKLDIISNKYPSSANSTQLAELELLESSSGGIEPGDPPDCAANTGTEFTIAVIGDTQVLSVSDQGKTTMITMMQYLVDRQQELNLIFVIALGDMTQNTSNDTEWARVKAAYGVLRQAGIPFAPCQGNHDGISSINKWFPVSDFNSTPTWGGSMNGGIENAFYLFSAANMDFVLVLNKEPYDGTAINWAGGIYSKYSSRRGIFATHNIQPGGGGQTNLVTKHDNIFMAVVGHDCRTSGEDYWTSKSPSGYTQNYMLTDYQCRSNGGAFIRTYTFKPGEDSVCARTYNITTQAYETDSDSEFCFAYDM